MKKDLFEIINPYNQKVVGSVKNYTENEIRQVVKRMSGFQTKMSARERGDILNKLIVLLEEKSEELALLISSETGLSLKDTSYEVVRVISSARFSALYSEKIEMDVTSEFILTSENHPELTVITEPLDLVLGVTPFNHPMNQVAHKLFPAIIAGSPIIIKPSEKTPLGAIKLLELLRECGLEEEMAEVITHENPEWIMKALLSDFEFDLVSLTGGLEVGKKIRRIMDEGPNILKRYVPELGGCSSLIICDDADLEIASNIVIRGVFKNSGQRCTCIRRVLVDSSVKEPFINILKTKIEAINHGNPYDENTDLGTVISSAAASVIDKRIKNAVSKGAQVLVGGNVEGALVTPTLIINVDRSMELVAEETFGPVCPILDFQSFEEALEIARDTPYALAGGIVTNDEDRVIKAQNHLKVGQFSLNGTPSYRTECAPFGGFKSSGNGEKEGIIMSAKGMRRMRTFYRHNL